MKATDLVFHVILTETETLREKIGQAFHSAPMVIVSQAEWEKLQERAGERAAPISSGNAIQFEGDAEYVDFDVLEARMQNGKIQLVIQVGDARHRGVGGELILPHWLAPGRAFVCYESVRYSE